ncbi:MAG: hypothetical protein IM669_06880 [Phenylobacterium sp.]|uniref:hypothetical protein n=1 Tax=Phenylobacterium sp. TaxID=1871053 RepID=UPI002601275F|nr:hypothetical protein [Phenylobacterium sp.]MCA3757235.1 hypothetical protein [Phenylobacterium sp.]
MTELVARSCWSAGDARKVLVTEALAGDDALFLATHSPVRGFEVGGSARDVEQSNEEGLLTALSDPKRRHAFCVVQGEPGSGKSHLIRWLSVNWPKGGDLPILVQRANGSLDGALRQLQARLPAEFQPLFEKLGRRQVAGLGGRAAQFLLNLGGSLAPDFFEKPLDDAAWCRENDPSRLLLNNHVREGWSGPLRILKLMDGGGGERNSASASFDLQDILDLARLCGAVHDSVASEKLARILMSEADFVREAVAEGRSLDEVKAENPHQIRRSLALIDALNARRNYAVQTVIGVSADGLKKLFEELRAELAKRGRRVVLLLEDITSWEGLDDSLVDALVTDADTRPEADLCPLISVVGVTPEYYAKLPGNIRQRITHDVRLGQQQGLLQDVAALRESEDRAAFVARYLNAARAGPASLREWRERFRTERTLLPPNACQACARADACHAVFGDVDGVGFFPFTRQAIDNLFFALKEDDGGQTHRTPRGILQGVLGPSLLQPKVIDDGHYPGPQIETAALDRRALPGALQGRLNTQVGDPKDRDRLRRLLAYWGDRRPELRRNAEGGLAYAGLTRGLVAAFGLPWIADDAAEAPARGSSPASNQLSPPVEPARETQDEPLDPGPALQPIAPESSSRPRAQPAAARPSRPAATAPNRTQLERIRNEVSALRDGQPLQNSTAWNSALFELLQRVDYRKLGVDRWTWGKVFTSETVKIAGTGAVRAQHFVVERTDWLADGLEAYATLRMEELAEEEAEYSRRRLAFLIRRLETLAATHLAKRFPPIETGAAWSPVSAVTQVLLARAWLRGTTSADRPTHEQWTDILSDESPRPESEPASRTAAWQEALNATDKRHDLFRNALREMVRLPQGVAQGFGISDASVAAAAMAALIRNCNLSPVPSAEGEGWPDDFKAVREVALKFSGLPSIPLQEQKLIAGRSEQLLALLRNQGLIPHLARLDQVISETASQLSHVVPHLVRDWKTGLNGPRRLKDDPSVAERIQNAVFDLTETPDALPARNSSLLGWLAAAPAGDLKAALDLSQQGEKLIGEFLPHVSDVVSDAGRGADFAAVRAQGATLRAAAARALGRNQQEPAE